MARIGIVAADFHKKICEDMIVAAKKAAKENELEVVEIIKVPGTFDTPLPLKQMLARDDIDGAVVLGAVVQGQTSHDEIVAYTAAQKIMDLSLQFDKPVGYGICGPRMSLAQAQERAEDFSTRAVIVVANSLGSRSL
ncbi:MAG TPA: 6,7-dimethyl-8-ribityllumazine synthase [archaeon]|nr:6,7-dimethyl-8-ribityllumazine synthase [archaeon]